MTLKEKFKQWLDTNPTKTLRDIQLEVIADDFAIGFAEWVVKTDAFLDYGYDEALQIYKKEKGL